MPHNTFFVGTFDITSLIFGSFVLFFLGLIIYLRREDRREGYPLEDDVTGALQASGGLFFTAQPKTFILGEGQAVLSKPNTMRESREIAADQTFGGPGSPFKPRGDAMLAGVGPGSYAQREKTPEMMAHGGPKILPLRVATDFSIANGDPEPRGMKVIGADGEIAGVCSDVWVDKAECLIRYLEVELGAPSAVGLSRVGAAPLAKRVLVPMPMVVVSRGRGTIKVAAILAAQFANVPALASPDQITKDEEERVAAYYGGGYLYATPARLEPLI